MVTGGALCGLTQPQVLGHLDWEVASGFDLHFTKPVDPTDLIWELREHVKRMGGPV